MAPLIYFRCCEPLHEQPSPRATNPGSPITFHEGQWAYCAAGRPDGHKWERIAGTELDVLKRRTTSEVRESGGGQAP
jgi:hypothetical protein